MMLFTMEKLAILLFIINIYYIILLYGIIQLRITNSMEIITQRSFFKCNL